MNTAFRHLRFASIAVAVLAVVPCAALAQNATGAGTQSAIAPPVDSTRAAAAKAPAGISAPAVPQPALSELAWLAGRSPGSRGPRAPQQTWTAPKAGVMMRTFQLEENDKTLVLELFTVVDEPDGIKFHLRHFTPSLVAWEK